MTREDFITHVERSQKAFRRFLLALCLGDASLADDIAQDSYVKAYLSCDGFSNADKFEAWIFKIGYNTFLNHKRCLHPYSEMEEARHVAAEDSSDSRFQYQELYSALERLTPKERSAILLFYMQGYSIKEIAETTDASESSVRQQLTRGRIHLRGLLTN